MKNACSIAIDGPAASGKTAVGTALARRLGYRFLDTGGMYRAVTLVALRGNVNLDDDDALTSLAEAVRIDLVADAAGDRLLVDDEDVTDRLRDQDVDQNVSQVSAVRGVRTALVRQQRRIGEQGSIVMVGRDIGTVVLSDAKAKVYLDATVDVRANRRYQEINSGGPSLSYQQILQDLANRDRIDSQRTESPLTPADDAMVLDTKDMTVEQVVESILAGFRGL